MQETKFVEMTFEDWLNKYKPIPNHLDTNASFQDENGIGIMFETYGDEYTFVNSQQPEYIWTYCHGDNNCSYISNGYHYINRLGYFISSVPFPDDEDIQIVVQEDNYLCENCEEEHYENVDFMYDVWGEIGKCPKCATPEELAEAAELENE